VLHTGSTIALTVDHLQAYTSYANATGTIFAITGGNVTFTVDMTVQFASSGTTDTIPGSCKFTLTSYYMANTNTWTGHGTNTYDAGTGLSQLVDDGLKSAPSMTGKCGAWDTLINTVIGSSSTVVRSWWAANYIFNVTNGNTTYPQGS
jgi:hypothetical protein